MSYRQLIVDGARFLLFRGARHGGLHARRGCDLAVCDGFLQQVVVNKHQFFEVIDVLGDFTQFGLNLLDIGRFERAALAASSVVDGVAESGEKALLDAVDVVQFHLLAGLGLGDGEQVLLGLVKGGQCVAAIVLADVSGCNGSLEGKNGGAVDRGNARGGQDVLAELQARISDDHLGLHRLDGDLLGRQLDHLGVASRIAIMPFVAKQIAPVGGNAKPGEQQDANHADKG
jgi:hypothetical protein